MGNRWSEKDIKFLKSNYPVTENKKLAEKLRI